MFPVPGVDFNHVVDARVVGVLHFGEPEVGAFAGMAGHDVVDDGAAVPIGSSAHLTEFFFGAEGGVDTGADSVEMPVHTWRLVPAGNTAGEFDRPRVHGLD